MEKENMEKELKELTSEELLELYRKTDDFVNFLEQEQKKQDESED